MKNTNLENRKALVKLAYSLIARMNEKELEAALVILLEERKKTILKIVESIED